MARVALVVLSLLQLSFLVSSQDYILCDNFQPNPIGMCQCEGQSFMRSNCRTAFFCSERSPEGADGCLLQCPPNQIVVPNFAEKSWRCEDNSAGQHVCVGEVFLECPENGYDNDLTADMCDCEWQSIVSSDCSTSFYCDSTMVGRGYLTECPPGQIVRFDFVNWIWNCIPDDGNCPGLGGYKFGCTIGSPTPPPTQPPPPPAEECGVANPLGTCQCEEQFFISDDCRTGFFCTTGTLGCRKTCPEGTVLVPNFRDMSWECVDNSNDEYMCTGSAKLECPANFASSDCQCDYQLLVSANCRNAFYCDALMPGGGRTIKCPHGQRIDTDFKTFDFTCIQDDGNCPGMGGYKIGCSPGSPTPPPPSNACDVRNPLGTCACAEQFFVNDDCSVGFWCKNTITGCITTCPEGSIVVPNLTDKTWECVDNSEDQKVCIGQSHIECPANDIGNSFDSSDCDCDYQIMVSSNCRNGYYCDDTDGNRALDCPSGKIIKVDVVNWRWGCVNDDGTCHGMGGYKVGCHPSNPTPPF